MATFTTRQVSPFKVEILRNGKVFDSTMTLVAAKIRILTLELAEDLRALDKKCNSK